MSDRAPVRVIASATAVAELARAGVRRGSAVGLALEPGVGLGLSVTTGGAGDMLAIETAAPEAVVASVESELAPRWVVWSPTTASALVAAGLRVATCWDVAAVHRLLDGGRRADPAAAWAVLHGLSLGALPSDAPRGLFSADDGDPELPVRSDGFLRPDWAAGAWARSAMRLARWSGLACEARARQLAWIARLADRPAAPTTARAESAAELLCVEMTHDGLPVDRGRAEEILAGLVGPRPASEREAAEQRSARDAAVLRHGAPGPAVDLRSPGQVRALLRRSGIDVPDTRAGTLTALAGRHPLVDALLLWRKAERVATTYGYAWLDEHVRDGRLRGTWSASDAAAGRMTASSGLHNMPAELRAAVLAEPGQLLVRADLGQIEPRVLAAVSRDPKLALATLEPDMYAPVAEQLGVDRATAKLAVLGAMYGQTTGHGAEALRRLVAAYPVAMTYLDEAARAARAGRDLRTHGGRLVRMSEPTDADSAATGRLARTVDAPVVDARAVASRAAARGRYGRNAVVQGAAAELFKMWAATVRTRGRSLGATIVLCLHDELLVQVDESRADEVAVLLESCLEETARRFEPEGAVRFVAEVSVLACWADVTSEGGGLRGRR